MIDKIEIIALKSIALNDPEYFTRKVYRYYSENFYTPLAEVYKLPWGFVFNNYLEHIIEKNNSKDDLYDLCVDMIYPEKKKVKNFLGEFDNEEQELQAWIEKIERESNEKSNKENPHTKKDVPVNENPQTTEEEISLNMSNFKHLEDEMEE